MLTVRLGAVRRLALIALVALPAADAWVTISQSYWGAQLSDIKDQMHPNTSTSVEPVLRLGYLWSEPKNTDIPDGLGGGITWAFDDTLCDEILPEFSEKPFLITFVSCTEIQAAVHRGFAAWSDNSAKLTFIDVTEECRRLGQLNVDCPLAEVFVTHLTQENAASVRLRRQLVAEDALPSAERMSAGGETAALARSFPSYSDSFRSTNGFTPAGLTVETRRATISFNANLCWYLDSTFCSSFHLLKVHLMPLTTRQIAWIVRALLISVWLFAVVGIIWHVLVVVKKAIEHDTHEDEHRAMILAEKEGKLTQTGGLPEEMKRQIIKSHIGTKIRIEEAVKALAHQPTYAWMLGGALVVSPITFYYNVFLPCWECFDFEAAATHEIGHVLGLSHPDEVADTAPGRPGSVGGENVQLLANVSNGFDCNNPWASAFGVPQINGTRESIMRTLTQHNPRVCITDDDLEALNVLYPDCSASMITTPVCYYASKYIGWARFFGLTFVPIMAVSLSVILLNECVRRQQSADIKKKTTEMLEKELDKDNEISKMVAHIVHIREKEIRAEMKEGRRGRHSSKVGPGDNDVPHEMSETEEARLRKQLRKVFDKFDSDKSNCISSDELRKVCYKLKMECDKAAITQMMHEADPDGSGSIDFEEFVKACKHQINEGHGGGLGSVIEKSGGISGFFGSLRRPKPMLDEEVRKQIQDLKLNRRHDAPPPPHSMESMTSMTSMASMNEYPHDDHLHEDSHHHAPPRGSCGFYDPATAHAQYAMQQQQAAYANGHHRPPPPPAQQYAQHYPPGPPPPPPPPPGYGAYSTQGGPLPPIQQHFRG